LALKGKLQLRLVEAGKSGHGLRRIRPPTDDLKKGSMKKVLFAAVAASLVALPLVRPALSEPAPAPDQAQAAQIQQAESDRLTLIEARIAAVKAGLQLTPAQQKDWDNLEKVVRDVITARAARQIASMKEAAGFRDSDDVVAGMKLAAKDLTARGEELNRVADAAAPLFASMDPAQKHRFAVLLHSFAPSAQK
jgi:zinc resistance-associated protein